MKNFIDIHSEEDIPEVWRKTPIGALLRYHNLGAPLPPRSDKPEILSGMSGLVNRRGIFISGLIDVGWTRKDAESHFDSLAPQHEIGPEGDFIRAETRRLRLLYPKVIVAPLLYRIEDGSVALLKE